MIKCPRLRSLSIRGLYIKTEPLYFHLLLKPLPELTHLDISDAFHKNGMTFDWLQCLPKLVSLTLHNVKGNTIQHFDTDLSPSYYRY